MNYSLISASDYCLNVTDGTHDSPKETDSSYYLITSKHLKEFELDKENAYTISVEDFNKINLRSQVSQYDILFSMIGTVGRTYLELDRQLDYAIKNLGLFSTGGNYKKALWLYYYFKSPRAKEYINQNLRGSTQQYIPLGALRKFPIMVLNDTKHMEKISKILFDIDKKILINKQLIASLERYTQNLFAHWFIDFEFPNEQGLPYKSNGGKVVESEFGLIPEEFEVINLDQILKVKSQKIDVNKLDVEMNYIGLEHMPRGSVAINNWETSSKVTGAKTLFDKGDILFGKLRPYFKKVGISPIKGVSSTDILVLNSREEDFQYFLLFILSSDAFIDYATQGATGTRMPRADLTHMKKYKIIIPNNLKVLNQFNKVIRPIIEKYTSITLQNIQLQDLRDTLLPKLLSGEIELPIKETVEN